MSACFKGQNGSCREQQNGSELGPSEGEFDWFRGNILQVSGRIWLFESKFDRCLDRFLRFFFPGISSPFSFFSFLGSPLFSTNQAKRYMFCWGPNSSQVFWGDWIRFWRGV